ncbi:hypothetical protein D3C87_1667350 [compost metagenome]
MLENRALVQGRLIQVDSGAWRDVPEPELQVLLGNGLVEAFDTLTNQTAADPTRRFDYRLTTAGRLTVWPKDE